MIRSGLLISSVMVCCAALAEAHTHAQSTMPAEGSTVQAPKHLMFMFSEAARLTSLNIQKEGEAVQKIEALPTAASAHMMVPAPVLANGKYTVTWRAMGKDDHVVSGSLHFTVSDKAPGMAMMDCCKQGMGTQPGAMGAHAKPDTPAAPATPATPAAPADEHAGHKH